MCGFSGVNYFNGLKVYYMEPVVSANNVRSCGPIVGGHIAANVGFPRQEVVGYREGMSLIKHYRVRHLFQERISNFSLFRSLGVGVDLLVFQGHFWW